MDGWMDGWMDGCMHACMHSCIHSFIHSFVHSLIHTFIHSCSWFDYELQVNLTLHAQHVAPARFLEDVSNRRSSLLDDESNAAQKSAEPGARFAFVGAVMLALW